MGHQVVLGEGEYTRPVMQDTNHFAISLQMQIETVFPSAITHGLAFWVLQSMPKPAYLLGVW